jgi:hypothetical protein
MAVLDRPATDAATENGQTDAGASDTSGEAAAAEAVKRVRRDPDQMGDEEIVGINIRMPNALRKQMAATAEEENTSVPQLILSMLAQAYSFTLPEAKPKRVKKYASKEERLQAQKDAQQHKRLVTRAILEAIEAGKINVDIDALVADLQAQNTEGAATS